MKTVLMDKMSNALQYLNTCLAEREELMRFMAVAVLTRRNLFILGLPGQQSQMPSGVSAAALKA